MEKIKHLIKRTAKKFKKKPTPDSPEGIWLREVGRWKKDGAESRRYLYDLDQNSVVFDMGGYEGQFAAEIYARYRSKIQVFEPIRGFAKNITERFAKNPDIKVYALGLSDKNEEVLFSLDNNSSSQFLKNSGKEKVQMRQASEFLKEINAPIINLMKINIEGGEYALLEDLIANDRIKDIKNFQIQFHTFAPNASERMKKIQEALKKTHHLTFEYPFVWENWEINK